MAGHALTPLPKGSAHPSGFSFKAHQDRDHLSSAPFVIGPCWTDRPPHPCCGALQAPHGRSLRLSAPRWWRGAADTLRGAPSRLGSPQSTLWFYRRGFFSCFLPPPQRKLPEGRDTCRLSALSPRPVPDGVLRGGGVTHGGASPPPVVTCADSAVLSVTRGGVTCSGVTCGSASPPPVVTCADSAVLPVTLALSPSRMPRIILPGSSSGNLQGTWAPTPEAESAPLAPESGCPLAPVFPGCPLPSPMPCPALGKQRRTPGNPERGSPALGASVPQGVCRVPGTPFHFSWQKCVKSVTTAAGAD